MNEIFDHNITTTGDFVSLTYSINCETFNHLKNCSLGKSVLFTSRDNYSTEKIISAYRSQYHVESSIKQFKDRKYITFTPIRHFTDNNIDVHGFYCVSSYTLSYLLNLEFSELGYNLSMDSMLSSLSDCQQVVNVYLTDKKIIKTYSLTKI
jgi:transposase